MKDNRLRTIFLKNFFVSLILSSVPCFLLLTTFLVYVNHWNDRQIAEINISFVKSTKNVIEEALYEVENFAASLSNNLDVQAYIASNGGDDFTDKCRSHIRTFQLVNEKIDDIFIVNMQTNRALHSAGSEILVESGFESFVFDKGYYHQSQVLFLRKNNSYPYVLRIVRGIFVGDARGIVVIDVDLEELGSMFKSVANDGVATNKLYILSSNREILYGNDLSKQFGLPFDTFANYVDEGKIELDGTLYSVAEANMSSKDICFLSLMPIAARNAAINAYWRLLLISLVFLLIVCVLFSVIVSRYTIRPISTLLLAAKQNWEEQPEKISPEIRYILDDIAHALSNNTELKTMLNVRIMRLKMEHIRALEAQINPHFLYNTLDSINWSLYKTLGRNNEISPCVGKLSEMLRMGFQANEYVVTFADEVQHATAYKDLLQYGEANFAEVTFQVPQSILYQQTVKFILQPLIENAVRHGLREKGDGKIWVSAENIGGNLVICVKDDGIGMESGMIEQLNKELSESGSNIDEELEKILADRIDLPQRYGINNGGVGLKNVNSRIKLVFGEKYGVKVFPNEPSGLAVVVTQPIKE